MTLHNILHDISEQSDAETSNLWHRIAHQIEEENLMRKSKNRRLRLSVTWAMALLGILVMSSAIFGRSQRQLYHPVTIEDIERMAVPLNLVKTNYDLTIQLDWGYADATQVVVAYSLFDTNGDPFLRQDLVDDFRVEMKHLYPTPDRSEIFVIFPTTVMSDPDSAQNIVRFSIPGHYFAILDAFLDDGFDITEEGVMDIQLDFFQNPPYIPFAPSHRFEFEIPFGLSMFEQHNSDIEFAEFWDTPEPITDVEVNFNDLVITDSSTQLSMCIKTPTDNEQTWYVPSDVNLYVNNHLVETVSVPYQSDAQWSEIDESHIRLDASYVARSDNLESYCVQYMWHLAFEELPQNIRIEIPEFHARIEHEPDNPISQAYVDLYAEEGYQLEYLYNEEYDQTNLIYPPEFEALPIEERQRIDQNVREALNDLYPLDERFSVGWEYEFEINPETE